MIACCKLFALQILYTVNNTGISHNLFLTSSAYTGSLQLSHSCMCLAIYQAGVRKKAGEVCIPNSRPKLSTFVRGKRLENTKGNIALTLSASDETRMQAV